MPRSRKSYSQVKNSITPKKRVLRRNRTLSRLSIFHQFIGISGLSIFKKTIGIVILLLGLFFIFLPNILTLFPQESISTEPILADTTFSQSSAEDQIPTRIIIPSVSIDLPITIAPLKNGYWIPSETTASFGEGSSLPTGNSNTVIFAHAREGLFLPLRNVKVQDTVYVMTANSYVSYTIDTITEVKPTDVYTVKPTDDKRLTLFTCSGFLDQKRLLVVAKPT